MKNYYFFILTFLLIGQIYGQNEFYFQVLSPDSLEAIHEPNTFGITDALWGGVVTEDIVGELISLPIDDINQLLCDTTCLLYTSPSPRDRTRSRMPSSA